jgi:glycerol-3-phosphate dehydrogenase
VNRSAALAALQDRSTRWDALVIGGGATGLGVAVDAAARGLRVALVEQHDFAKGTSSRSTKLIHGGFRYLKQGNVALVRESLRERGRLLRNAPHLVRPLAFVVPCRHWWEAPYYGAGLKLYDWFAGAAGLEPSRWLARDATLAALPNLQPAGLRGGIRYCDGQFDDAALALALAQTVFNLGGIAANYVRVTALLKENGRVAGARVTDAETGAEWAIHARVVINATGVFTDSVRRLDEPAAPRVIAASQGAHLVLPREFLPGDTALVVPRTDDGRVLFVIPWHGRVLVGTTDTPVTEIALEPRPLAEEIEFLLGQAAQYLARRPTEGDILSVTAGLRPLVQLAGTRRTASLPRDHVVLVSPAGLVSIAGGKWTTYRQMAADAVDRALAVAGLPARPCATESLLIADVRGGRPAGEGEAPLHPQLTLTAAEVAFAAREQMARSVEDVLARRTRALLLDARAARAVAPQVAAWLARELGRDAQWEAAQVSAFNELADRHLPARRA